jgi:hypothetical protein
VTKARLLSVNLIAVPQKGDENTAIQWGTVGALAAIDPAQFLRI